MNQAPASQLDELVEEAQNESLGLVPDAVEVRRNGGLAALVGAVASTVSIAYLARATGTGSLLDWSLFALMGALGLVHLLNFVDARTPLLVADTQGVRIRLGRTWRGVPWGALARVELLPRRGVLHDGRLVLVARNLERVLDELDASGRRQSRIAEKLYGAPLAVPLALSTRLVGHDGDLNAALTRLAGDDAPILDLSEVEDATTSSPRWHDPRPILALTIGAVATRLEQRREARVLARAETQAAAEALEADEADETDESESESETGTSPTAPVSGPVASATPSPLREPLGAMRAEVRSDLTLGAVALSPDQHDTDQELTTRLPEARELRRPGSVNLVEETVVWGDRVSPIARPGSGVAPLVIDEFAAEPAEDPVIGPELAAARTRLGLTVDQLADRTRIRPHVIESIEVDDFVPCGGDFYARGHLRTLARVLGVDVTPLLESYDDRYAAAPVNARRVFEAELATGMNGSIRSTRGGPNWSVLVAVVMALVLAWSIARLVMDSPIEITPPAPQLNGSAGPNNSIQLLGDPVPVVLTAVGGGANVTVYDGAGNVNFSGNLAFNESRTLERVAPPVRVRSSDGSLTVTVDGQDRGALGAEGQPAQNTFPVR